MKLHFIFFAIISTITLHAINSNTDYKVTCIDSNNKQLMIKIQSNKLNLTEDALQDNLGGYVDIPATNYYIKTSNNLYHIDGVVKKNYEHNINQFISYINNNSNKLINIQEFVNLRDDKNVKFIQKIDLEEKNQLNH